MGSRGGGNLYHLHASVAVNVIATSKNKSAIGYGAVIVISSKFGVGTRLDRAQAQLEKSGEMENHVVGEESEIDRLQAEVDHLGSLRAEDPAARDGPCGWRVGVTAVVIVRICGGGGRWKR